MEGVKVYVPDEEHVWLPGVVRHATGSNISVQVEGLTGPEDPSTLASLPGEQDLKDLVGTAREIDLSDANVRKTLNARHVAVSNNDSSEDVKDASLALPLQNTSDSTADGFADMITIDHLHEASILYNLRQRFFRKLPYTYTGSICIAVNPYQWLDLYEDKVMHQFSDGNRESKPPHVYAVSMEAFFHMKHERINQSILVSGESGAGKTETTKIVMSHLATLATNSNSKVIQQIIQANPLLESFGNAKTVRNDNSSRFGKFTELQFSSECQLLGARSRTYLLEKSRVTTQAPGERNFHIFYQLLAEPDRFQGLHLPVNQHFHYLTDGVFDPEEGSLGQTCEALELIGISGELQHEIFQILAAILHLGETTFSSKDGDVDASQVSNKSPFGQACELLGVEMNALELAVCSRNVHVGREVIPKPMTSDQASDCRDALAKSLYSKLFLWLVDQINETIGVETSAMTNFIGILDIFGFEHFEHNSFEQFCINYANEKLQQKFVQDVLKTVQIEYEEENISWSHVTFADNQDVLDLIEGKLGVISFLNEESLLATGTDAAFASKLGAVMAENELLEIPRLNKCAFTIQHYAGKVTYDASGFLDKHRDQILPDIKLCMSQSSRRILSKTFEAEDPPAPKARPGARRKTQAQPKRTTVGSQFKESLSELMDKIGLTEVHYVRCLKPNSVKSAYAFQHAEVVNQLRCAGVIEAIRVSRSAYPSRLVHAECVKKFYMLLPEGETTDDPVALGQERDSDVMKQTCEKMMEKLLPDGKIVDYQVGLTRVYFREGILEKLESQRAWALRRHATLIQKVARGFVARRRYVKQKTSVVRIQTVYRRYVAMRDFIVVKKGVTKCQARFRGQMARKNFQAMKFDYGIIRFQASCRAFLFRRKYLRRKDAAIRLQRFWRFTLLRLVFLRKMEKEKKYKALGSKVANLQNKLNRKANVPSSSPKPAAAETKSTTSTSSTVAADSPPTGSSGSRNSMYYGSNSSRFSLASTGGILDESNEVIKELHDENEKLRMQLEQQEDLIKSLKQENRALKEWQQSKEVDDKVQKMAHRDQESKDLSYLYALESEYEKLRAYICDAMELPPDTGSLLKEPSMASQGPTNRRSSISSDKTTPSSEIGGEAQQVVMKSASRLAHARSKVNGKGSARRVKDFWEEIRNFPPPMHYSLGSVPWKRLLTDWAQGNPKKLDYMTRWLKNVLDGGPIVSDTFPMGVELKYVTPMMLDGFMQLIIPKLAERSDIKVHVHTKEFIGTSMRITLSEADPTKALNASYSSMPPRQGGYTYARPGSQRKMERSQPMDAEDFQRISILANNSPNVSPAGGPEQPATRPSMSSSPSDSNLTTGSGKSGGLFRGSRSKDHDGSGRHSFFGFKR